MATDKQTGRMSRRDFVKALTGGAIALAGGGMVWLGVKNASETQVAGGSNRGLSRPDRLIEGTAKLTIIRNKKPPSRQKCQEFYLGFLAFLAAWRVIFGIEIALI